MTKSRSVLLRMRNASDKSCRESQTPRFRFNIKIFANFAVYEKMLKKIFVALDRPQITLHDG